jgi:hypothetical protein
MDMVLGTAAIQEKRKARNTSVSLSLLPPDWMLALRDRDLLDRKSAFSLCDCFHNVLHFHWPVILPLRFLLVLFFAKTGFERSHDIGEAASYHKRNYYGYLCFSVCSKGSNAFKWRVCVYIWIDNYTVDANSNLDNPDWNGKIRGKEVSVKAWASLFNRNGDGHGYNSSTNKILSWASKTEESGCDILIIEYSIFLYNACFFYCALWVCL